MIIHISIILFFIDSFCKWHFSLTRKTTISTVRFCELWRKKHLMIILSFFIGEDAFTDKQYNTISTIDCAVKWIVFYDIFVDERGKKTITVRTVYLYLLEIVVKIEWKCKFLSLLITAFTITITRNAVILIFSSYINQKIISVYLFLPN